MPAILRKVEVLETADASLTLFHPRYREAYHPRQGALAQARRLYLEGTQTHRHPAPRVLELGFGLGVNFRATLAESLRRGVYLRYLAVEREPLPKDLLQALPLPPLDPHLVQAEAIFREILATWPRGFWRGSWGELVLLLGDIREVPLPPLWATAVYLDPFSPRANPEAWEPSALLKLRLSLLPGGRLATYSAAGRVRRALRALGFRVESLPAPWKRAWTVATSLAGLPGPAR